MSSKWGSRTGILGRHVGHPLVGIDSRSVACTACSLTLLLDANRESRSMPPGLAASRRTTPSALPPAGTGPARDPFGRRECIRCQKVVSHGSDGEPAAHTVLGDPSGRPCIAPTDRPVGVPAGGWRGLVARLATSDAEAAP